MTLDHIPVSLGCSACLKRTDSSSDLLQSQWHLVKRILSESPAFPFPFSRPAQPSVTSTTEPSSPFPGEKSLTKPAIIAGFMKLSIFENAARPIPITLNLLLFIYQHNIFCV